MSANSPEDGAVQIPESCARKGWTVDGKPFKESGQAHAIPVVDAERRRGVLKVLKPGKDRRRFLRELEVLRSVSQRALTRARRGWRSKR